MLARLIPGSPHGVATTCASAGALIAAGVFPIVAVLNGFDVPTKSLIASPIAIILGGALHYLAACGALARRKATKKR